MIVEGSHTLTERFRSLVEHFELLEHCFVYILRLITFAVLACGAS